MNNTAVEKTKIIQACENLDFHEFVSLYEDFESKNLIEHCFISDIFNQYDKVENMFHLNDNIIKKRKNQTKNIQKFLNFIINHGMIYFEDEILERNTDEVIIFDKFYKHIGLNLQHHDTGNTLLHYQFLGLNFEGIKHLLNNGALLNIKNFDDHNCLEVMFLNESDAFNFKESSEYKEKILNYIYQEYKDLFFDIHIEDTLLYKTLDYQIEEDKLNVSDLIIIIKCLRLYNVEVLSIFYLLKFKYREDINKQTQIKMLLDYINKISFY